MKLLPLFFLPLILFSYELQVELQDIKVGDGTLFIGLYQNETHFTDTEVYYQAKVQKAEKASIIVSFTKVPEGEYAVSVFHDENGNKKPDTNFLGMPLEGYGFSNNPSSTFSKPTYEMCQFRVDADKKIVIEMEY